VFERRCCVVFIKVLDFLRRPSIFDCIVEVKPFQIFLWYGSSSSMVNLAITQNGKSFSSLASLSHTKEGDREGDGSIAKLGFFYEFFFQKKNKKIKINCGRSI
jgi:hypothetical protein